MFRLRTAVAIPVAAAAMTIAACSHAPLDTSADPLTEPIVVGAHTAAPVDIADVETIDDLEPVSVEAFIREHSFSGGANDLDAVEAEYRAAVRAFPYDLPAGYAWPAATGLEDDPAHPGAMWERGNGVAQAFSYWEGTTALAAANAAERGDFLASDRYLGAIGNTEGDGTRGMYIDDGRFTDRDVVPAFAGDWSGLQGVTMRDFIASPINVAIAEAAGDSIAVADGGRTIDARPAGQPVNPTIRRDGVVHSTLEASQAGPFSTDLGTAQPVEP